MTPSKISSVFRAIWLAAKTLDPLTRVFAHLLETKRAIYTKSIVYLSVKILKRKMRVGMHFSEMDIRYSEKALKYKECTAFSSKCELSYGQLSLKHAQSSPIFFLDSGSPC